jgi:hypothetical protein
LTVTRVNRSYRCGGTVPLGGKPPEPGIGKEHQMGDYAAATLTLIGVSGKEQQVLEVLESGWCLEFGAGGALALSDLSDEIELCDDQCSVGWIFDGCGSSLVDLGVAYEFCQDAKYEYDATVEIFLPGLACSSLPVPRGRSPRTCALDRAGNRRVRIPRPVAGDAVAPDRQDVARRATRARQG